MELNLYLNKDNPEWIKKYNDLVNKAIRHVQVCIEIYNYQRKKGRLFLHEHPWLAKSWKISNMISLVECDDVILVRADMCHFGMVTRIGKVGGPTGPAKKPTGFLTNSAHIAEELNHRCPGDHVHIPLMGGRAAGAAIYPEKLCEAVCRGLKSHKESLRNGKVTTLPLDANRLRGIGMICE